MICGMVTCMIRGSGRRIINHLDKCIEDLLGCSQLVCCRRKVLKSIAESLNPTQ